MSTKLVTYRYIKVDGVIINSFMVNDCSNNYNVVIIRENKFMLDGEEIPRISSLSEEDYFQLSLVLSLEIEKVELLQNMILNGDFIPHKFYI